MPRRADNKPNHAATSSRGAPEPRRQPLPLLPRHQAVLRRPRPAAVTVNPFSYQNPFVRRALGELLRVTRHRVEERHREPSPPEWALCVLNPCLDLHDWHTPCGPWTLVPRTPRTSCDACRPPPRRLASRAARCTSVARWHTSRGVHAATARFPTSVSVITLFLGASRHVLAPRAHEAKPHPCQLSKLCWCSATGPW